VKTVWICTPAHGRLDLSEVCFDQHAWVARWLRPKGIEVASCVVACDENLELAHDRGFYTVERANDHLGARWNDAYQYAANQGADFICPLGSDSWIHPEFFTTLPPARSREMLTGKAYAVVDETGGRLAHLEIVHAGGVGPNVIPTWLLRASGWRPVTEHLHRGCDHSLISTIGVDHDLQLRWHDFDSAQYIGFKTGGTQLNSYDQLTVRYSKTDPVDPWPELARIFPAELVEAARNVYTARAEAIR
jgi:hypothetical protein